MWDLKKKKKIQLIVRESKLEVTRGLGWRWGRGEIMDKGYKFPVTR